MDSLNANEAELLKLNGYNALMLLLKKILFQLLKVSHPCKLANLVEEVQAISTKLGVSFHHIPREANIMEDSLAGEGVFGPST